MGKRIPHPGISIDGRLAVIFSYTEYFEITKLPSGDQIGTLKYGRNLVTAAGRHSNEGDVIKSAYNRILIDMQHEVLHIEYT